MKSYLMVPFSWPILCAVQGQKHVSFAQTSHEFVVYSNKMGSFNIHLLLGGFVIALTSIEWFFTNTTWYGKHSLIVKPCCNHNWLFFINKFLAEATNFLFHFSLCWDRTSTRSLCVQCCCCPNCLFLLQIPHQLRRWKVIVKKQLMLELIQIIWES